MIINELLSRFNNPRKQGKGWQVRCPAHDDKKASLSIAEGADGRILLHCHAGCSVEAIAAALGVSLSDLFPAKDAQTPKPAKKRTSEPEWRTVTVYSYLDESGALLFQVERKESEEGKKFPQRRPDGKGGWIWNLDGVRRVLYRLPELLAADPQATVFVTEGEKDADALRELGLVATCNPMGATTGPDHPKWLNEFNEHLKGREVVILPDNDEPGRKHAQAVARSLHGVAASVRILPLPDLPEKGDVSDWLNAGGDAESLCVMAENAAEWKEESDSLDHEESRSALSLAKTWADFDAEIYSQGERIAFAVERGEVALVNALPNAGKTTLALNAALSLAAGRAFPPVVEAPTARKVLYIDGETRRSRLQRDIRRMTKDFSRDESLAVGRNLQIICEAEIEGESLSLTRPAHFQLVNQEALRVKPDFIVVDTLASLCSVFNENDNSEQQRRIWTPLQKLARQTDAAILVLHHVGKRNEEGQSPERVYRGRGASAAGGAARAVWLLTPDPVSPRLSTLACVKAKGEPPADTRFQLDDSRWMRSVMAVAVKPPTPLDHVLKTVCREMKTAEIVACLRLSLSKRAVEEALAEALRLGHLLLVKRGVYAPVSDDSADSADSANDDSAERAESAESSPKTTQKTLPHIPQTPIVRAESAETVTYNPDNSLQDFPQNGQNTLLRKARNDQSASWI